MELFANLLKLDEQPTVDPTAVDKLQHLLTKLRDGLKSISGIFAECFLSNLAESRWDNYFGSFTGRIHMAEDGEITFDGECWVCLRCYNLCPKNAVLIGKRSVNDSRFVRYKGPTEGFVPPLYR